MKVAYWVETPGGETPQKPTGYFTPENSMVKSDLAVQAQQHYRKPGVITRAEKVIEHGGVLERGLSIKLQRKLIPQLQKCWLNALHAVRETRGLLHAMGLGDRPLMYVEGWMVLEPLPIPMEHGWLQVDDIVIEPTLPLERDNKQALPYHYTFGQIAYYPAFVDTPENAMVLVSKSKSLPILPYHPDTREQQAQAYRDARHHAHVHVFGDDFNNFVLSSRKHLGDTLTGGW